MKVYLVMQDEDWGDSCISSVFAERRDAELHLSKCVESDKYDHYSWYIDTKEVK